MQDTEEIWKDVVGYEGLYQVSNRGNIIKLEEWRRRKRKISFSHGYAQASISKGPKSRKVVRIHRLVAEAFIPNPENKPFVNHINHKRGDNRVENLEWCTSSENLQHASKAGRLKKEPGSVIIMNSAQIQKILHLKFNHKFTQSRIARIFRVSDACICGIIKRNRWSSNQCKEYLTQAVRTSAE